MTMTNIYAFLLEHEDQIVTTPGRLDALEARLAFIDNLIVAEGVEEQPVAEVVRPEVDEDAFDPVEDLGGGSEETFSQEDSDELFKTDPA